MTFEIDENGYYDLSVEFDAPGENEALELIKRTFHTMNNAEDQIDWKAHIKYRCDVSGELKSYELKEDLHCAEDPPCEWFCFRIILCMMEKVMKALCDGY